MKAAIVSLALLAGLGPFVDRFLRETNSRASVTRGIERYRGEKFDEAERAFRDAAAIAPGATTAFDLGTAQVAAGEYAEGSATLGKSLADPRLGAAAYYNRGNSALAANALDHAIADYTSALRIRPDDFEAKRNLEIALRRKAAQQQQQQQGGGPSREPESGGENDAPSEPRESQPRSGGAQQSAESILRSVEQQEREELNRMRRAKARPRTVGW